MKATAKLSSEERRAAIVKAVRRLFAEKGFDGTTTRELAAAAGVSEALLFKHFPNKEALYEAMQLSCLNEEDRDRYERLNALEPSASTLVLMVHFVVSLKLKFRPADDELAVTHRLMFRSLTEDGDFARHLLACLAECWVPKVEECLKAAAAAWFTHHLAAAAMLFSLPQPPVVDFGVPRDKLVEQAVWFALRGVGLTEEAIKRYYNPKALALLGG